MGVDLQVGHKDRPDQAIIIKSMDIFIYNMDSYVRRRGPKLESRYLIKDRLYSMSCFWCNSGGLRGL